MYTTDVYTEGSATFGTVVLLVIIVVCAVKALEALVEIFPTGTVESGRAVWRLVGYGTAVVWLLHLIESAL